jgi:hypothetical protein
MSNKLYVGLSKNVELPDGGYLFIDDEIPNIPDWKRPKIFDPLKHGFNPLKDIDYRKAREIADVLYTVYPQGENTLTVRNGKRALLKALLHSDSLDKIKGDEEVSGMIGDILASPILRGVFCEGKRFTFNPKSANLARINRAELGRFDALVLGLLLIAQFKGQLAIPSFGFYGRDAHVNLIEEGRLIAGVNTLGELSPLMRQNMLLVTEKVASGAIVDDAEELAKYEGLPRGTNGFLDFVAKAIA